MRRWKKDGASPDKQHGRKLASKLLGAGRDATDQLKAKTWKADGTPGKTKRLEDVISLEEADFKDF